VSRCEGMHLTSLQAVRALDNELSGAEAALVAAHLRQCSECREVLEELRRESLRVEALFASLPAEQAPPFEREQLKEKLVAAERAKSLQQSPEKIMWRFGWGMAIAATLAVGILLAPRHRDEPKPSSEISRPADSLEVDGETFIALPYSNPDLPMGTPRIVQMQVPLSSLAEIGIMLEPVSNGVSESDRSVLADVLMGADGQPLGVNVLSWE